jgi:hypothetical protein
VCSYITPLPPGDNPIPVNKILLLLLLLLLYKRSARNQNLSKAEICLQENYD